MGQVWGSKIVLYHFAEARENFEFLARTRTWNILPLSKLVIS